MSLQRARAGAVNFRYSPPGTLTRAISVKIQFFNAPIDIRQIGNTVYRYTRLKYIGYNNASPFHACSKTPNQ